MCKNVTTMVFLSLGFDKNFVTYCKNNQYVNQEIINLYPIPLSHIFSDFIWFQTLVQKVYNKPGTLFAFHRSTLTF